MKLIIQVLDNGYTLSASTFEEQGEGERKIILERKQRFAFETKESLNRKLEELLNA